VKATQDRPISGKALPEAVSVGDFGVMQFQYLITWRCKLIGTHGFSLFVLRWMDGPRI
jgi:hypothetical protein